MMFFILFSILLSTIFTLGMCIFFFHSEAKEYISSKECVILVVFTVIDWVCIISELATFLM